jgi:hypothetical protein
MKRLALLEQCRRPGLRSRVSAAAGVLLLLAAVFAVTHSFDSAAHANGQPPCAVCLSTATLGAGAAPAHVPFTFDVATPVFVASVVAVFVSVVPARRYARGPPPRSFAL